MNDIQIETCSEMWGDGTTFFTKRWTPVTPKDPRALIIFLHGFAEHVERYDDVWPVLVKRGFEVYGYDQRGFGKSSPRYGDTTLPQQVADLEFAVLREMGSLKKRYPNHKIPIFLYGHSMVDQNMQYKSGH